MDGSGTRADIERLLAVTAEMREMIGRSMDHLREMYAFLRSLEPETVRPPIYVDDHPLCCGVPMWLTTAFPDAAQYTCQVCDRKIVGVRPN